VPGVTLEGHPDINVWSRTSDYGHLDFPLAAVITSSRLPSELQLIELLLAAVFATAGIAKLADLPGSRKAVAGFGVSPRLTGPLGTLLPLAELATAALLVAGLRVGSLAALGLLALFCVAIGVSVARGRAPDCHCFGQLHSAPASTRTLLRNGVLLTLAALVAGGAVWAVASALAILAAVTLVGVLARDRREPEAGEGLAVGTDAPEFELPALAGGTVSLADLLGRGQPVLLVFSDPGCGPCTAFAPELADWQRRLAGELTIAVVERWNGTLHVGADEHGLLDVLLQREREVSDAYRAYGTPSAVLISQDGRVASLVAGGATAIEALLGRTEPSFARRELLVRAAAAWAAGAFSAPAWATQIPIVLRCRYARCGDKCCPKTAKCERRGARRVCICPDKREACGDKCCPPTSVCRSFRSRGRTVKRCVCGPGYSSCGGRCIRTRSDPRNCGRCGVRCPAGTSCVEGRCVGGDGTGSGPGGSGACTCPPGQACCQGQCTDLNENEHHCGRCGQACAEGETCCEGRCKKLDNDPQNCGRCGKRCAEGEVCGNGDCRKRCPSGQTGCKGRCVDTKSDASNCGRCEAGCTGATDTGECCNGTCCSYNAQDCCPNGCKNLALDDENCGSCGTVCPPKAFCRFGVCTEPI